MDGEEYDTAYSTAYTLTYHSLLVWYKKVLDDPSVDTTELLDGVIDGLMDANSNAKADALKGVV